MLFLLTEVNGCSVAGVSKLWTTDFSLGWFSSGSRPSADLLQEVSEVFGGEAFHQGLLVFHGG